MSWASYVTWIFVLLAAWGCFRERSRGSAAIALCLLLAAAVWGWGTLSLQLKLFSLAVPAGPFEIDLRTVPAILFVFVTLLVLYRRYRDQQARQLSMDQDLAAARRMQEHLLAPSQKAPAGFAVEAVYRPAREVGGDFYRTVPLDDGSLLVILGDVSGKGLDAAMLVAVILGSLANETDRSPASLLAYLNRAVMGRTAGGFITACCACFYPGGRVVFANAGQISPYLDGRELQLENGLPLGISAGAAYIETEVNTDAVVTFVSDGVVEARDARSELLGFERLAALTTKRAAEIADAAQR
jgi:phosphoserine phosphatase RsbU/P